MATINDIAAQLGVSKSTVSKALNNATDISEDMRKRILETALQLGYSNKRMQKREKKLCIIIENMEYETPNQFGYDMVRGFREMAEPEGWIVDVVPVTMETQRGIPYGVFMLQHGYHGAFILGFCLSDSWMHEFKTTKIPTVLYDNYIKDNPNVASVGCDNYQGFELAVKHLIDLGHKKIGLISGPLGSYITQERYDAYLSAMKKFGLEINDDFIGLGYYVCESAQIHLKRLYDKGVTAILFSHDIRAIAAINECNEKGIQIPKDLSIIGFDDLPMTEYTDPALTTIQQDRLSLGKGGYYALSSLLNHMTISMIQFRAPLIIRNSTGPAPTR